ncbi:MAG: hypothetical protein HY053_06450 [Proteobacteria bacterium]|nr:hypothetical protein [Pseudomonadota bacterium]
MPLWLVVAVVYENVRQYQANRELQSIVQNVRQLEMRISSFSDSLGTDITATLDNQTAFPVEMRVSEATANGNLNHPWSSSGNTVHLLVEGATSFGIKFTSVPKKSCITLATKLSSGELQGLTSMEVGGTTVAIANLPINVVQAAGMCTSSNANTVKWVFNLRG